RGVEAVAVGEEVGRRLRRAADPGELRDPVRGQVEREARLDDRRADRVVSAARAESRDRALVVAARVAELVGRQLRMVEPGLRDVGHGTAFLSGTTLRAAIRSAISSMMKRAVMGVPS